MGRKIAGVVLAGGKSSRMGQNKAFLDYKGKPLLDHMIDLLKETGLSDIYVSGDFEGYQCIPDNTPHEGPAHAIENVLSVLDGYGGVLFIPVDMPFLTSDVLEMLISQEEGAYFENNPLPAYIKKPDHRVGVASVRKLLQELKTPPLSFSEERKLLMANINTPEEWQEALKG